MRFLTCTTCLLLAAVLPGAPALHAEESPLTRPAITKLKQLYPETILVKDGHAESFLTVPDGEEFLLAAQALQGLIRAKTGVALSIQRGSELVNEDWGVDFKTIGQRNIIALGNVNNNRLLSVLYGQRYVVADSIYPGKGGYVVRTVHDPFARGINVLLLGGSDLAGVKKALSVFREKHLHVKGKNLVLPRPVIDIKFEKKAYRFFPDATHELSSKRQPQYTGMGWFEKQLTKAGFMNERGRVVHNGSKGATLVSLTSWIARLGQTYFRTGDTELPSLMKELLDKNRHLLQQPARVHGMGGRSASHVHQWDLLEELPVWTDRDRLDITNALLRDARLGYEKRAYQQQVKEGAVQALDENHGTFSAQRTFQAWHYFHKYYQLPESDYWMRCAAAVFSAQASTFQILEDASGYLCYCVMSSMDYALRSGDLTYFKRGIARHHARYVALACINNLGLSTGFGDAANLVHPEFFELLAPAAWFYRDPKLYWIVKNVLPQSCGLRIFQNSIAVDLSVKEARPVDWAGLVRIPLYEAPLVKGQAVKKPVFAPEKELPGNYFNKIVFKENWDPEGQYLLLDGAGAWGGPPGPHGHKHDDLNTIINFTSHGRMWLVDHTYEVRGFDQHSGVYVVHNGKTNFRKRTLARLNQFFDTPALGMTQSQFLDWKRSIFWRKGRYFAVVDQAMAEEDGEYFARCSFRALGKEKLEGKNLFLRQGNRSCVILSDGAAQVDVETYPYANRDGWIRFYPHARPVVKIFQQDKFRTLKKGESIGFINLLQAWKGDGTHAPAALEAVSQSSALIHDAGSHALLGAGPIPGLKTVSDLFFVQENAVMLAGATEFAGGAIQVNKPCNLYLDLNSRELRMEAHERVRLTFHPPLHGVTGLKAKGKVKLLVNKNGLQLDGKSASISLQQWPGLANVREAIARAFSAAKEMSRAYAARPVRNTSNKSNDSLLTEKVKLGAPINVLRVVKSPRGKIQEKKDKTVWIVAGSRGVGAYNPDGTRLWQFKTAQPVRVMDTADTNGDGAPEIAAGCDDHMVYFLDTAGKLLWSFECKPSEGSIDGPPKVNYVQIVDLDGDGKKEIIAGANWLHVLNADGSLKWEKYMTFRRGRITGDFTSGEVTDLDGDGEMEIIALFNTSYPVMQVFDPAGKMIAPANLRGKDHPGFNTAVPVKAGSVALYPGGKEKQIVCAFKDRVAAFWHDQKKREQAGGKLGGTFTDMVILPAGETRRPIVFGATSLCEIIAIVPGKKRNDRWIPLEVLWRRNLAEKVTALLPQRVSGMGAQRRSVLYAGTKNGSLFLLDALNGKILGQARTGDSPITCLTADPNGKNVLAANQQGDAFRM